MQNRCPALRALLYELRAAKYAVQLLFEHMREVTTFLAKTVAIDVLSISGHNYPST
jgi:hypothetical protein